MGGVVRALTHLEVLCDLTNEPLEGQLADEELRRLLVATNFTKGYGTRPETVRLLDATSCRLYALGIRICASQECAEWRRTGAVLRAALAASCLRGALPPVDLRAVCLVRAIADEVLGGCGEEWCEGR